MAIIAGQSIDSDHPHSNGQSILPTAWLAPVPYGNGFLPNSMLPGPMEGVSQGLFVECYSRFGLVPCWITPFVRVSTAVPRAARLRSRLAVYFDSGLPVVVQLMGTDTRLIAETARVCRDIGAIGLDLNCGCPSNTVVGSGAGGSLLRNPQWIRDTLLAIRSASPGAGVSVKLRSGFEDARELDYLMPIVCEASPDFVTFHFRTVTEQYRAVPGGRRRTARGKELAGDVSLIASGDLFTIEDVKEVWRQSGCDGVAPARGLLRNPFLLQDIATWCRGVEPVKRGAAEILMVLISEAELAAEKGITQAGFLKEVAGHAFGRNSKAFTDLVKTKTPREFADTAKRLQRQQ